MNRIDLLETRRAKLMNSGKKIRDNISSLCDEGSFVEYDSYSFSKNDFYGEDAEGEGVVTGFMTIDENPFYVVAQNAEVLSGGISNANCAKIVKCLRKAENSGIPVVYLLNSLGVQAGEGVSALEGIASVLNAMTDLKGNVLQIAVVLGDVYGSFALVASTADYSITVKDACVSYASPLVISAGSGKNLPKDEVGGVKANAFNNLISLNVKSVSDVKNKIVDICDYTYVSDADADDDMQRETESLNSKVDAKSIISATFDNGKFLELNNGFANEVVTGIGRIGGTSVASIVFDGGDKGVELNFFNVLKIKEFAYFAAENELPLVTFVNTVGLEQNLNTSNTPVLKEISNLIYALKQTVRISVVYGKAIGLGYTLFAAKSLDVDYSYAFANACVGLFDDKVGACVEFSGVKEKDLNKLAEKYANDVQDPINAAKNGYIDNIIEPRHVRQYVIAALETL